MAACSRSRAGFTMVELLAYISIYLLLLTLVVPCVKSITAAGSRLELEGFCQRLAADISALQQDSLWGNSLQNKFTLDLNGQSYNIYRGGQLQKTVRLAEAGQGQLYFYSPNTWQLHFSDEGAPNGYFYVLIKNRQQPQLAKKFEVQPVTGRIVISDIK